MRKAAFGTRRGLISGMRSAQLRKKVEKSRQKDLILEKKVVFTKFFFCYLKEKVYFCNRNGEFRTVGFDTFDRYNINR